MSWNCLGIGGASRNARFKSRLKFLIAGSRPKGPRTYSPQTRGPSSSASNSPMSVDENARLLDFASKTAVLPLQEQHLKHRAWRLSEGWSITQVHEEWKNHPCHLRMASCKATRRDQAAERNLAKLEAKRRRTEELEDLQDCVGRCHAQGCFLCVCRRLPTSRC